MSAVPNGCIILESVSHHIFSPCGGQSYGLGPEGTGGSVRCDLQWGGLRETPTHRGTGSSRETDYQTGECTGGWESQGHIVRVRCLS